MTKSDAINSPGFAVFLVAYVEALLWSSSDTTADGEDVNLDRFELSTAGADKCRADCLDFFTANQVDLATAADCDGYSWARLRANSQRPRRRVLGRRFARGTGRPIDHGEQSGRRSLALYRR